MSDSSAFEAVENIRSPITPTTRKWAETGEVVHLEMRDGRRVPVVVDYIDEGLGWVCYRAVGKIEYPATTA